MDPGMSDREPRLAVYEPSGRVGARGVGVWLIAGVPCALGLGYLLALAQAKASGWLSSTICTLLAAVVIGLVFSVLADRSRSRSVRFNTVMAGALLAVLMAVRWLLTLGVSPEAWGQGDADIWSHVGSGVGALLEVMTIAGLALMLSRSQARYPYSENSKAWAAKGFTGELWSQAGQADILRQLQAEGVSWLLTLTRANDLGMEPVSATWQTLEVSGLLAGEADESRWLTVRALTHTRSNDGKVTQSAETVIEHWVVSSADYEALHHHLTAAEATADTNTGADTEHAQHEAHDTARPTPVELQAAVTALESEQYSVAGKLAQPHCQHPDARVRADAWRLCAISRSRLNQWPEAFEAYHALFDLEPSAMNALQLATTSVMQSELLRGQAWYDKAVELNANHADMPAARLCTAYLSALEQAGEYEATQPHLNWLAQGYRSMGITDDHFVWTRGFPFFGEFLRKSDVLLRMCVSDAERRAWYESLKADLDEAGQEAIAQHLTTQAG